MKDLTVGYIRVSTDDQLRQSPTTQYKEVLEYLHGKGWRWRKERFKDLELELDERISGIIESDDPNQPSTEAKGIFTESGSGWTPDSRPEFERMIKHIEKERIKHVIFCWTDRIARNLEDYTDFCKRLRAKKLDVHLHIINEDLAFSPFQKKDYEDQRRLEGRLVESKAESGRISKRVSAARRDRFEKGRVAYKVPYGYRNKREENPPYKSFVEIVPEQAKIVKEIFQMMASAKYSLTALTEELEGKRYRKETYKKEEKAYVEEPFTRSYLYYMLTNEAYLGRLKHLGKTIEMADPTAGAIIDNATFNKVQSILSSHSRKSTKIKMHDDKYSSPFASLCMCHFCGCKITTDVTVKPSGQRYVYLRCTNGKKHRDINWYKRKFGKSGCIQPYNTETGVAQAIENQIQQLWMDEYILEWLSGELFSVRENSDNIEKKVAEKLNKKYEKLEKRKSTLIDMRADEEISKDEYLDKKAEVDLELNTINNQLNSLQASSTNIEDEIEITINLISTLGSRWKDLSDEQKVEVLHIMTKKIVLGKDGKNLPKITWEKPWDIFINRSPIEKNWYARQDSNLRPSDS